MKPRGRPELTGDKKKDVRICVRVNERIYDRASALARRNDVSVPHVLRHALARLLREDADED